MYYIFVSYFLGRFMYFYTNQRFVKKLYNHMIMINKAKNAMTAEELERSVFMPSVFLLIYFFVSAGGKQNQIRKVNKNTTDYLSCF